MLKDKTNIIKRIRDLMSEIDRNRDFIRSDLQDLLIEVQDD